MFSFSPERQAREPAGLMVDAASLQQLADEMKAANTAVLPISVIMERLIQKSTSNSNAETANDDRLSSSGFLDDSVASSISSTMPSPSFGDVYLGGESGDGIDFDRNATIFNFKTPQKTFNLPSVSEPPPAPPVSSTNPFTFSIGSAQVGDHKAQIASIKKKGSSRSAKKKAAFSLPSSHPAATTASDTTAAAMPPVPPPNHSSPEAGLNSPVASSKPYPFGKKQKDSSVSSPTLGSPAPSQPQQFHIPGNFIQANSKPENSIGVSSLNTSLNKMAIDESNKTNHASVDAAKNDKDPSLGFIAAKFSNINFSSSSASADTTENTSDSDSNVFKPNGLFVFNGGGSRNQGSTPFSFGSQTETKTAKASNSCESLFGTFTAPVDFLSDKVSKIAVSSAGNGLQGGTSATVPFTTDNSSNNASSYVFSIGASGQNHSEGNKGKKIGKKKAIHSNQNRFGVENKNKGNSFIGTPRSSSFQTVLDGYFSKDNITIPSVLPVKDTSSESRRPDNSFPLNVESSFDRPDDVEKDSENDKMDTEDEEDDKRMIAFADLLKSHGSNLFSSKSYEGALDAFSKALDNAPVYWASRLTVMSNKAACLFMLNKFPDVVKFCDETINLCRKQHSMSCGANGAAFADSAAILLKVFSRKGRALLKLGDFAAAHLAFAEVLDSPRVHSSSQFDSKESQENGKAIKNESDMSRAEEDSIRADVKAGVKQVLLAKVMFNRLLMLESQSDPKQFSTTADDLLKLSPELRSAQCFKASALCKMQDWPLAKEFIEACVCDKPVCIQQLHAVEGAILPVASKSRLNWSYDKSKRSGQKDTNFAVNIPDIANACLVMGGKLSQLYVWCLKNDKHSRFLCAETMEIINNVLTALYVRLFGSGAENATISSDKLGDWNWVKESLTKLQLMASIKNKADTKFRGGDFAEALNGYREFVKMDSDANLWNAVMYGNKAATLMRLSMYAEAVLDCHHSLSKDSQYYRSYLRRARARKSLGELDAAIADYVKYLSAPYDDPGISSSDRRGASAEMNEISAAIEKQKNDAAAAAKAKAARDRAEKDSYNWENMFGAAGGADSEEEDYTSFSYRNRGRSTTDSQKSTYDHKQRAKQDGSYQRNGGGAAAPGEKKKSDPSSNWHSGHNTRSSTASGSSGSSSYNASGQGSSHRHRAWESSGGQSTSATVVKDSHYTMLGISQNATEKEIKTAYRQLALKFHPDKNKDAGAEDKFKDVTAAYSVLSDKTTRRTYDYNIRYG